MGAVFGKPRHGETYIVSSRDTKQGSVSTMESDPLLAGSAGEHQGSSVKVSADKLLGSVEGVSPEQVGRCRQICQYLTNYDKALESGNFQDAQVFFAKTFGSLLLVANFSLGVQYTKANPHHTAGLMTIQAFSYEVLHFLLNRLRKHKSPVAHHAFMGAAKTTLAAAIVETYFMGDAVAHQLKPTSLGDMEIVGTLAAGVAANCVLVESMLLPAIGGLHEKFMRMMKRRMRGCFPSGHAEIAEFAGQEKPDQQIPLFQRIADEGNYSLIFLFSIVWIFAASHHLGFAKWIANDKAHLPEHAMVDFQFAMQAGAFSVAMGWIMAGLIYLLKYSLGITKK